MITISFETMRLFLCFGQYKKAIHWLNNILSEQSSSQADIKNYAKAYQLILCFEMENFDLLESRLLSFFRQSKKNESFPEDLKLLIKFFKELENNGYKFLEDNKLIIKLISELRKIDASMTKNNLTGYILVWLESKINRRTMPDIAKEMIKKRELLY